jgi:transcriptional regulator with PAS, ATPase and Fis domain
LLKKSKARKKLIESLNAEAAGELIAAVADILLKIDKRGVICDVIFNRDDFSGVIHDNWLGKRWADTVTAKSRPKVATIVQDAASKSERRWRPLDHPAKRGADVRILYSAIQVGKDGDVIVVGRDLRGVETLQQSLARVTAGRDAPPQAQSRLLEVLEAFPDGLVVTSPHGDILTANPAFLELAQLATVEQVRGRPLDRWLGRPGIDMRVLVGNLRRHGSVRRFATTLRGEHGSSCNVEVAAVFALNAAEPSLGISIRTVEKRAPTDSRTSRELPHSAQELTELISRAPLKELVRETTEVIERLCIEAALRLTADNRATAAELLGLSRQSLYAKLRHYGLGDLAPSEKPK